MEVDVGSALDDGIECVNRLGRDADTSVCIARAITLGEARADPPEKQGHAGDGAAIDCFFHQRPGFGCICKITKDVSAGFMKRNPATTRQSCVLCIWRFDEHAIAESP